MAKRKEVAPARPGILDELPAHGRGAVYETSGGLLHHDVLQVIEGYQQLRTEGARAAYANQWIQVLADRMDTTWPILYDLLRLVREREMYRKPEWVGPASTHPTGYPDFASYFEAVVKRPFTTWAELETTAQVLHQYAPDLVDQLGYGEAVERVQRIRERDQVDAMLREESPHGGAHNPWGRAGKPQGIKLDNIKLDSAPDGTSERYALRRLRTQRPDLHARVLAGDCSPHAAMIAAGFRRHTVSVEPTVGGLLRAAIKLGPADARALAREILEAVGDD